MRRAAAISGRTNPEDEDAGAARNDFDGAETGHAVAAIFYVSHVLAHARANVSPSADVGGGAFRHEKGNAIREGVHEMNVGVCSAHVLEDAFGDDSGAGERVYSVTTNIKSHKVYEISYVGLLALRAPEFPH